MRPDQASVVPSSVVASASTFTDAQQTVDYLRSYGMDSRSLEVVGAELRLSRRQAAVPVVRRTLASAGAGALLGVLSGVFVTLVAETTLTAFSVLLWGFVYGVLVGAMWGLFQGLVRNRPDAPAVEVIVPSYYEVRCALEDVSVALTLLGTEPEPVVEPEPEPALSSRLLVQPPQRLVAPEPEPEPVLAPEAVIEPAPEPVVKPNYLVEPPQRVTPSEPEPVVEPQPEPAPEPVAESKPVVDEKPPVRRQPSQTTRKARAKKKTARTNAA
ncbi:general stress protein [Kribbella sp. NPDC051587]|uniref:general stress protein n=1 Tax=Kribbella sp. NPDC051587 TaxID=3364119 RepID=UPI00379FC6E6